MSHEVVTELARSAPPVVVTGLSWWGVSLSDWLILLTIMYTIAQFHFLLKEKSPAYRSVYCTCINFLLRRNNGPDSKG